MEDRGIFRTFSFLLAVSVACACIPVEDARAQGYPSQRITFVVPHPAGTVPDNLIRPIGQVLSKQFGQPIIVENKTGAAGQIGMSFAARATPDGYTFIVYSTATMAVNPTAFKKLSYDPTKDFVPVALIGRTSMMYLVRSDSSMKTIGDISRLAAEKGAAPLSIGQGNTTAKVAATILASASNLPLNIIPYQASSQVVNDLLGGVIDLAIVDIGTGMVQAGGGRVRPLAIAASKRLGISGAVPTLNETFPNVPTLDSWMGVGAPANTPPDIVQKMNAQINAAIKSPELQQVYTTLATEADTSTPEELGAIIRTDQKQWPELLRKAGIEPQ